MKKKIVFNKIIAIFIFSKIMVSFFLYDTKWKIFQKENLNKKKKKTEIYPEKKSYCNPKREKNPYMGKSTFFLCVSWKHENFVHQPLCAERKKKSVWTFCPIHVCDKINVHSHFMESCVCCSFAIYRDIYPYLYICTMYMSWKAFSVGEKSGFWIHLTIFTLQF